MHGSNLLEGMEGVEGVEEGFWKSEIAFHSRCIDRVRLIESSVRGVIANGLRCNIVYVSIRLVDLKMRSFCTACIQPDTVTLQS